MHLCFNITCYYNRLSISFDYSNNSILNIFPEIHIVPISWIVVGTMYGMQYESRSTHTQNQPAPHGSRLLANTSQYCSHNLVVNLVGLDCWTNCVFSMKYLGVFFRIDNMIIIEGGAQWSSGKVSGSELGRIERK